MVLRSFSDPIDGPFVAGLMSNRSSTVNFPSSAANNVSKMLEIPASTPQELIPIVTLYNAQQARSYIEDSCFSITITQRKNSILSSFANNEKKLHPHMNTINNLADHIIKSCYASLSGNELSIYDTTDIQDNNNSNLNGLEPELKNPLYINISDASFHNSFSTNTLTIKNPSINVYHLQFKSVHDHVKWFSALLLAYFESNSLNEAYTAGLLAARAVALSDIKTLLQPTRFSTGEWCNIKVSYLGSKWFRAYVVTPNNSNSTKERDPTNPEDCVSVYSTDKNTNKKNLIMTFSKAASCAAVFPSTAAAIDLSSLIRVGDVNVHIHNWKALYQLLSSDSHHKGHGHSSSNNNSFIMNALQGVTSNTNNWSAPNSPASSSGNRSRSSSLGSRLRKKRSTMSLLSNSDVNSSITDDSGSVVNFNSSMASSWETEFTTQVYIIPEMHPGVASFETLIRTLIPLLDSFELYGRPKRLRSDRHDPQSLLFGLPVLPKLKYLDLNQVNEMVSRKIQRKPSCRRLNSHTGYIPVTNSNIKQIEEQNRKESSFTRKLFKKFSSSRGKKEAKNTVPPQGSLASPGQARRHSKSVIDVNPVHYPEYISPRTSDIEEWSNEDWCSFLKCELKYLLGATNYEGAGHLAGDFDEFI